MSRKPQRDSGHIAGDLFRPEGCTEHGGEGKKKLKMKAAATVPFGREQKE